MSNSNQSASQSVQQQTAGSNLQNKSFNDRLRAFLKTFSKGTSAGAASTVNASKTPPTICLTEDLVADLSHSNSLSVRVKALQAITETCKHKRIESNCIERLWSLTSDLFQNPDKLTRHATFCAYTSIIEGQFEKPGFLRAKLFSFVKTHEKPEDTYVRFMFLRALSENGRDVSYFEEKIGPFLLAWMMHDTCGVFKNVQTPEFMDLLTNVVKFNVSFLDDDVLGGIIHNSCIACLTSTNHVDTTSCISFLNTTVMYSMIPTNLLKTVMGTLCRTVNVEALCTQSWKVVRNLLGTHLGHSGLFILVSFMDENENNDVDTMSLIRGAVFYTGVCLWGGGNRVVRNLLRGGTGAGIISVVLKAYVVTLKKAHAVISYEVLLRVQDLVKNSADSLQVIGWDLVLEIMEKLIKYSSGLELSNQNNKLLAEKIHDTLDLIENIIHTKTFCGDEKKYWTIVQPICHSRPASSVEKLVAHKSSRLQSMWSNPPTNRYITELTSFTVFHFASETRPNLRLKALQIIQRACLMNQDTVEEALLDNVILPHLKNIELEESVLIRQHCVEFIVAYLMDSRSKKGHDLLHYIEKVVNRPFESPSESQLTDKDVSDIVVGISGIVKIFQRKVYSLPSSIAVTAYKILARHLNFYYKPVNHQQQQQAISIGMLENCSPIRYMIFECFFRIRANSLYHLGFPNEQGVIGAYSSYLAVNHKLDGERDYDYHSSSIHSPSQPQQEKQAAHFVTYMSLTSACKHVISCLKKERDWKILELVLLQLPHVMENKALILSKHGNDVDLLATQLCFMITDKNLFTNNSDPYRNIPLKFSRSDLNAYVFPALTSLVSYHSGLESKNQLQIVKCLETGLVSKSSRICISALTTCTLEMKEVMHKMIPEILLSLSKISPKLNIAIPVLEFLSTLIHLPRVFASFVQDQYMSIFAICLPYTNPFKFNHYVVSLAHHVIAMWFLKCRLSFRKGFVSYIIKGLESNVWAPLVQPDYPINEDSSNRKRSSSLTDQGNRRRERILSGQKGLEYKPAGSSNSIMQFHQELTETCVDLMARYAFADCSPLPSRFDCSNFLVHGGNTQSWMIDNRVITVSTSGCSQRELREGLCDKCYALCKEHETASGLVRSATISGSDPLSRRRHKSAFASKNPEDEVLLENKLPTEFKQDAVCGCWCNGWAEILIRRPTGNTSWMMRVQNIIGGMGIQDNTFKDLSAIYLHEDKKVVVKRSNSSPEMGGSEECYAPSVQPIPEEESKKEVVPMSRDRMFTISVMTPARRTQPVRRISSMGSGDVRQRDTTDPGVRSGVSPSFIFLQLCGQGIFGGGVSKPLLLPSNDPTTNSLKVLDYIPPYETHKIGVLYVGAGQANNEAGILQNSHGSVRYQDFLRGLGCLIKLKETDPVSTFLGGLDGKGDEDGEFAYIWQDDLMQVIFHVATLMPSRLQTDPNCNGKKRHIGNDFVAIVYNNSDQEFDISTIKCQFLYACVIIQPLDHRTNRVFVKAKPTLADNIGNSDVKIVSDQNLPIMARQLALHSNLASVIHRKISQNQEPYASNWLERLRAIKRLRARLFPETIGAHGASLSVSAHELNDGGASGGVKKPFVVDDFTEYV